MPINDKFYIVSIITIFLTLGIGIFIGVTITDNDVINKEQKEFIDKLELDFINLRETNRKSMQEIIKLRRQINSIEHFLKNFSEQILGDRLLGKKIALIETNKHNISEEIKAILEMSGAEVIGIIDILPGLSSGILSHTEKNSIENSKVDDKISLVIGQLLEGLFYPDGNKNILQLFQKENLLTVIGNFPQKPDYVILIGGASKEEDYKVTMIDLPIINKLKADKVNVIGAEPSTCNLSYITEYKQADLTTVDNIESILGQISLVLVIEQGIKGNFGIKDSSERLLPY